MPVAHRQSRPVSQRGIIMKELVFALQFKGKAGPVEGSDGKLAAKTSAGGQVLRTAVPAKGLQVKPESKPGPRATLEAEVQMTGEGTFVASGCIRSGKAGKVTLTTLAQARGG